MKKALLLFAFCLAMMLAGQGSSAQTQADLNKTACSAYEKADARMNAVYQQILNKYKTDAGFITKLKAAQRAWVTFRDAHLESVYPEPDKRAAYGSVNPMCRCQVLAEVTAARTKDLKKWVDGIEEGDVCSGSVKIKGQ